MEEYLGRLDSNKGQLSADFQRIDYAAASCQNDAPLELRSAYQQFVVRQGQNLCGQFRIIDCTRKHHRADDRRNEANHLAFCRPRAKRGPAADCCRRSPKSDSQWNDQTDAKANLRPGTRSLIGSSPRPVIGVGCMPISSALDHDDSCAATTCGLPPFESAGLRILNQMEYIAGKNTRVKIVPAKVPPISV
jgi:hypothetical protein